MPDGARVTRGDRARSLIRTLLPRPLYRAAAALVDAVATVRAQGWRVYRRLRAGSNGDIESVRLRGYDHPVFFRPGTPDGHVIVQNLVREEYGRLPDGFMPSTVIDGGSYIGDVALYYLNRFPACRVVALEPDPANRSVAARNLAPYGDRCRLLPLGLWSEPARLGLDGAWTASRVDDAAGAGTVECVDLGTLAAELELSTLDLVKLDIEGAEREVLGPDAAWLDRTRLVVVELHGAAIEAECTAVLEGRGFEGYRHRSLHYFVNGASGQGVFDPGRQSGAVIRTPK